MNKIFIERPSRIKIMPVHKVVFELEKAKLQVRVANISITGIGLYKSKLFENLKTGDFLKGQLLISGRPFPAQLKVVHTDNLVIGCCLENLNEDLKKAIENHLKIELAATELKHINPEILNGQLEGVPHWFTDKNGNELYLLIRDHGLLHMHATFFNHYVEWNPDTNCRTGTITLDNRDKRPIVKGADSITFDSKTNVEVVELAKRLVMGINGLDSSLKSSICSKLV